MKRFSYFFSVVLSLLLISSQSLWAECYVDNVAGISLELPYESKDGNSNGTYKTIILSSPGKKLTFNYQLKEKANKKHQLSVEVSNDKGSSWSPVWSSGDLTTADVYSQTISLLADVTHIRFKRTGETGWFNHAEKTISVTNIYVSKASSLSVSPASITFANTPVGAQSDAQTATITYTNLDNKNISVSSISTEFVATLESTTLIDDCGTTKVFVSFKPGSAGYKSGTITISSGTLSASFSVEGTAAATTDPTHTWKGESTYKVDDAIDLSSAWYSNSAGSRTYYIVSFTADNSSEIDATAPAISGSTLTLGQAGTLTIRMMQEASSGYNAKTSDQTITITKYDLSASISQATATWDETINNPFAISYDLNDYTVEALDPAIATYTDGAIQTYAETGTARFVISRAEDYKYNQLAETLSISVAPAQESCYVLEDNTQYTVGDNSDNKNGVNFEWEGAAAKLSVLVHRQGAGYGGFTISAYYGDGTKTTIKNLSRNEIPTSFGDTPIEVDIPAGVNKVNLAADGVLNKYFTNLKITCAPYFSPSETNKTIESTIGTNATGTIQVQYSSCGGTVKVVSDNPKITVSPTSFDAEGSGTQEITLTGDATALGTETATITIYDQSKKTTVNVTSTINRISQTISWQSRFESLNVFSRVTLDATASGTTDVVYSIAEGEQGKASIEGNVLSFKEAGTVHVVATAAQSDIYESVSDTVSVVVSLAQPVVSVLPTVEAVAYGTALTNAMLQGGVAKYGETTVEGSFAWADEKITDGLTPNTYSFNVRFTPADAKHYSTADCTVGVTVNKAQQTISWQSNFEDLNVHSEVILSATAQTAVRFAVSDTAVATITGDRLRFLKAGTIDVVAIAEGSDLYEEVADTIKGIVIARIDPVVSQWPSATLTYGKTLTDVVLAGEAVEKGVFQWGDTITDGDLVAMQIAGEYTYAVKFVPTEGGLFNTLYGKATITIVEATQKISWKNAPTACKVGERIALAAVASSGLAVGYYVDQIGNFATIDVKSNELVALAKGAIQLRVSQAGEAGKYAAAEDLVLSISIEAGNTTATEQVSDNEQVMVRKVLRDGVLYILRGGMCYDINGRLIGAE